MTQSTVKPQQQTLIEVATLAARLGDKNLRLVDCRSSLLDPAAGATMFSQGHIDGAQYADLQQTLSATVIPGETGRHPLPSPEVFVEQIRRWGISNDDLVVAYDADTGAFAARLWWMLRWLGHTNVMVLDGGLKAWVAADQPLTETVMNYPVSAFEARPSITRQVSAADLITRIAASDSDTDSYNDKAMAQHETLLDARDLSRFNGEAEPIDPVAGHIPGAVCAPFSANLATSGRFKQANELADRFTQLGISTTASVTCYCGSGVTAAHNILALVHAGFAEPALYPGSWSEWITDPRRPVATQ
ncbi:MAG: thiosulfate/3-mercaptopyruvate sulfurtransferase [Cyclobacteriaceae bacterium]|jgi:thiosulfate/3-mercaptopyruvate sulfurtransferase